MTHIHSQREIESAGRRRGRGGGAAEAAGRNGDVSGTWGTTNGWIDLLFRPFCNLHKAYNTLFNPPFSGNLISLSLALPY